MIHPPMRTRFSASVVVACALALAAGCGESEAPFDPRDPARGPGRMVGNGAPVSDGRFAGEGMQDPAALEAPAPTAAIPPCGAACQSHCAALALENPVDAAVCPVLWGAGLDTRAIAGVEACRRLFLDLTGRAPTRDEVQATCDGRSWGDVARALMATDAFVELNQRRWADLLLYNNEAVSVERLYDMDGLVGKLYRGKVPYDQFAAVLSAHPVLTRRHATAGDRAEALFKILLGRPPYESERSDLARLYTLWGNGYYDHPALGRLPDAIIDYQCVTPDGRPDPAEKGECTSVLWGFTELILSPDIRAKNGEMWSGLLRPDEWSHLQAPGRVLSGGRFGMWEHAVGEVLTHYLGYDLGTSVPEVRDRLIEYVLRYGGDIRAAHHAVVTSQVYLQSATGETPTAHRWTHGPLKQVEVEAWIDSIKHATGFAMGRCDHRIPQPELLLERNALAGVAVLEASRWQIRTDANRVVSDYRDLARTLGGCPQNVVGGRFKTISILTTATQEGFVKKVCNPGLAKDQGVPIERLLPAGMNARQALDPETAEQLFDHQVGLFYGRALSEEERADARAAAESCTPKPCTVESFARPLCHALLTSSELLFY